MDAARYFSLLRRWWWLPAIGALVAVAAYGVATKIRDRSPQPPVYRATVTLLVALRAGDEPSSPEVVDKPWDLDRLMATYAEIMRSDVVAERAARELGVPERAGEIAASISVATPDYTQLLYVSADAATAEDAEQLAGATAWAFAAVREDRALPGTATALEISRAQQVPVDATPLPLAVLLVALTGASAAAALVLAFEYLGATVRDASDAERVTSAPVLASLAPDAPRRVVMRDERSPAAAEHYRMLRTAFGLATAGSPVQAVLITAPSVGCGASSVAANFALAAAHSGRSVALVDADLRAPRLHAMFGVSDETGLAHALSGDLALDTASMPSVPGVALIPAGGAPENPSELLDSARFDRLLGELRERFDVIVIDSPPVLDVTDATVLAARCDASIVAVRADRTPRADASACVDRLRRAGSRVLGLVLTDDPYAPGDRVFFRFRTRRAGRTRTEAA
jgi:capsular exopolysaccharide synthesis family protein